MTKDYSSYGPAYRNFKELCANHQWIHIFPESCSWKFYAPLRPFKIGAFNMAYRHALPVIPLVISFRPRTGWRKLFSKDEPLHFGDKDELVRPWDDQALMPNSDPELMNLVLNKEFGTAVNTLMDNIEDSAVLIPFDKIYHEKKRRHIGAYLRFSLAKRRKNVDLNTPEMEELMIDNWLNKRYRQVKRLLKKTGRTF